MFRNPTTAAKLGFAVALTLMLLPLAAGTAAADPRCKNVHAHLFIEAEAPPGTCGSEIELCATATTFGNLRATTDFIGRSSQIAAQEGDAILAVQITGDNTFHTSRGDFFTRDAIVLSTGPGGEFAEVDIVLGGTGDWTGATGVLTATGTFVNGIGEGVIEGEICVP